MFRKGIGEYIYDLYMKYKEDIPIFIFAMIMLKFSRRWQDSALGYVFFPIMCFIVYRMPLERKLHTLIFLIPWAESRQLPGQMFGIVGFNLINFLFLMIGISVLAQRRVLLMRSEMTGGLVIYILMILIAAIRGIGTIPYFGGYYDLTKYFLNTFLKPLEIVLAGIMAFYVLREPKQATHFLRIIKLSGLMLGMYVLFRSGHTIDSIWGMTRTLGIHKNAISFIFLTLLSMNLVTMEYGSKGEKLFSVFCSAVYILAIMFVFSRMGYVTCVVVLFLYSMRKGLRWVVLYMVGLALFWQFFIPFPVKQRIFTGTVKGYEMGIAEHLTGDISAGRAETWRACMPALRDNILFGQGRFAYIKTVRKKNPDLPMHPHNAYIQSLLDHGIFGSMLFIGFYVFLLIKSWHLYRRSKSKFASSYGFGFFLCTVVFLLQGYTGFRFYPYEESYFFWFYLGGMMWVLNNQKYLMEHGM